MANIINSVFFVLVVPATLGLSQQQGIMCYHCAWLDGGRNSITGQFDDTPIDSSCKWGAGKPDDKFLVDCTVDEEEGFRYFYRCLYISVKGALVDESGPSLNGTFYGCGVRRQVQIPPEFVGIPENSEIKASKLCQQDRLDQLIRDYQDQTGKEFLRNLTNIFQPSMTRAHLCSCDFNCYEPERHDDNSTTEQDNGSEATTENPEHDKTSSESSGENAEGSCAVSQCSGIILGFSLFTLFYV